MAKLQLVTSPAKDYLEAAGVSLAAAEIQLNSTSPPVAREVRKLRSKLNDLIRGLKNGNQRLQRGGR